MLYICIYARQVPFELIQMKLFDGISVSVYIHLEAVNYIH